MKEGKTRYGNFGVIGRIIGTLAWLLRIHNFIIFLESGITGAGVMAALPGIIEGIIQS